MDQPPTDPANPTSGQTPAPASQTANAPDGKPQIAIDDFLKIDLRVATVTACHAHPNADKLLVLQLDDGTPAGRQICAGLRGIYQPEQLVGRQIVIAANLAPRTMRGQVSQGMLLAASSPDRSEIVIVNPISPMPSGSAVG